MPSSVSLKSNEHVSYSLQVVEDHDLYKRIPADVALDLFMMECRYITVTKDFVHLFLAAILCTPASLTYGTPSFFETLMMPGFGLEESSHWNAETGESSMTSLDATLDMIYNAVGYPAGG
ncbi:hypothetical protein EMCRGX_G001874 [Ephydatia muelleri]